MKTILLSRLEFYALRRALGRAPGEDRHDIHIFSTPTLPVLRFTCEPEPYADDPPETDNSEPCGCRFMRWVSGRTERRICPRHSKEGR